MTPFLPSSVDCISHDVLFEVWSRVEVDLRVGIGHELLQEIRNSACLYNYISRRQKESRGQRQMQAISKQLNTISSKKSALLSKYKYNWKQIMVIFGKIPTLHQSRKTILKGLQELDCSKDVKFFEEWGSQTGSYSAQSELNLSWIWRVAMEDKQPHRFSSTESLKVEKLMGTWENEGKIFYLLW